MFHQTSSEIRIQAGDFAAERALAVVPGSRVPDARDSTALLTVADVCRRLGVSRAWVIEHSNGRRRPVLPSIKLGKVRRFDPTDLASFIDDCWRIGHTRVRNG